MNQLRSLAIACLLLPVNTYASNWNYGAEIAAGLSIEHASAFRLAVRTEPDSQWLSSDSGYFSGYVDLSYNRWEDTNSVNVYALSPVLTYTFNEQVLGGNLMVEGGVGVSYVSDTVIGDLDLGGHFQFEDRIGVGIDYPDKQILLCFYHYSNANLYEENDGVNLLMLSLKYRF